MKTQFTFGNFLVNVVLSDLVLEGLDPENEKLIAGYVLDGCTQKLQRKPASLAEKEFAGYEKRPEGFKRNSIPYSEEKAKRLVEIMQPEVVPVASVSVEEYVPNVTESKFTEEKYLLKRHEDAGDLDEWLEGKVKYAGDYQSEDGEWLPALLIAVRAYKIEATKNI